jgi:hypothetical protein
MEQWGSDFSLDMNVSEDEAIERISNAFTSPSEGGSYEANLISVRNSEQVKHQFDQYSSSSWKQEVGGVSTWGTGDYWEDIDEKEGKRLNDLIRKKVNEITENKRLAEEKAKTEQKDKEAKAKETYERQQLEALKQKYEIK